MTHVDIGSSQNANSESEEDDEDEELDFISDNNHKCKTLEFM